MDPTGDASPGPHAPAGPREGPARVAFGAFAAALQARAAAWSWRSEARDGRREVAFSAHPPFHLDVSDPEVRAWMDEAHADGWTIEPLACLVADTLIDLAGCRTALDVGTHFGFLSLFLLRNPRLERVWGVEMNPGAADAVARHMALPENAGLRPAERYSMIRCALSDRDEPGATVWYEGMRLGFERHPRWTEARMDVRSLCSVVAETGGVPDLLKIDIEGYEGRLLRDLDALLGEARPVVLMELHWEEVVERHGASRAQLLDLFLSRGYACARLNWHQRMPRRNLAAEVTRENAAEMLGTRNHAMYALF